MTWQVLAAGLAFATGLVAQPAELAPDAEVERVAVVSEPYGRMTVPVKIRGTGPYRFMIDTGAQATVLSQDLASKLQLNDRRSATLVGLASRQLVETAAVDGIELGSRRFNVADAPLVAGGNIGGADGVLGLDSLQGQRVMIDFRDRAIHVADAKALGGNRGYEIVVRAKSKLGQLIITKARVDGVPVDVIIDTGAQGSTGNPALFAKLSRRGKFGDATITDINGVSLSGPLHVARVLTVDRVEMHNLPIMYADSPTFRALGLIDKPALILGMEELRLFNRVAIDFASQRVLFDMPMSEFKTGSRISS